MVLENQTNYMLYLTCLFLCHITLGLLVFIGDFIITMVVNTDDQLHRMQNHLANKPLGVFGREFLDYIH